MSVFSKRPHSYKVGLVFLLVGCLMFIAGFASPNWTDCVLTFTSSIGLPHHSQSAHYLSLDIHVRSYNGLWISCVDFSEDAQCESIKHNPGWLRMVQGLQCLALLGLVLSCCYVVAINCMIRHPAHNRLVEVVSALSGFAGFVGMLVYMVEARTEDYERVFSDVSSLKGLRLTASHVSWAFAVDVCGCVLSFLAAIVIGFNNTPVQAQISPQEAPQPRDTRHPQSVSHNAANTTHAAPSGYGHSHGTDIPNASNVNYGPSYAHNVNPAAPEGYPNNVNPAVNVNPMNTQNPIAIVTSQTGAAPTNVQVFYVPPISFSAAQPPPTVNLQPPAYDAQPYPPPPPSAPNLTQMVSSFPPLVSHDTVQCSVPGFGQPGASAAESPMADAPSPAEEKGGHEGY